MYNGASVDIQVVTHKGASDAAAALKGLAREA
jgi:hypothetical protein